MAISKSDAGLIRTASFARAWLRDQVLAILAPCGLARPINLPPTGIGRL